MKILLLRNNVTDTDTLNNGIVLAKQWCSSIGLDLQFSEVDTKRQFTSVPFSNSVNKNGYIVNSIEIFQESKNTGLLFDIDLLVFDPTKITPNPTNPNDGGMNMQIPTTWYATFPEVFAEFFCHELCHYFFGITGKPDITHNYAPGFTTRKDWYLFLLKGMIPPPVLTLPVVKINRLKDDGKETIGQLRVDDKFGCDTLELPNKNNQPNISRIPPGQYLCQWKFKINSLAYHYELQNVLGRTGIFIHSGVTFFDTKGCIIVGSLPQDINNDGSLDLLNSKAILQSFENFMGKKDFMLIIQ